MGWLPGWGSAENAGWWSHFYFWFGIVCLFLLGGSEVLSHFYGLRKDELTIAAESAATEQRSRAQEQERQRHAAETAQIQQKLAEAEFAASEIRRQQSQRVLTADQKQVLIAALLPFKGQKVRIMAPAGNAEGNAFAREFVGVFAEAQWDYKRGAQDMDQTITTPPAVGVGIQANEAEARNGRLEAASALIHALMTIGILDTNTLNVSPDYPAGEIGVQIGSIPPLKMPTP